MTPDEIMDLLLGLCMEVLELVHGAIIEKTTVAQSHLIRNSWQQPCQQYLNFMTFNPFGRIMSGEEYKSQFDTLGGSTTNVALRTSHDDLVLF